MKKKIKLGFVDKWGGFVPEEDFYYKLLARHYDIELSDTPDYLICSQNGHQVRLREDSGHWREHSPGLQRVRLCSWL